MFLSHIKTRHSYDFLLYFPHEFLMSFLSAIKIYKHKGVALLLNIIWAVGTYLIVLHLDQ